MSYEIGLQVKSDVSIAVYNKFKEFGIEIPFPQQDIHIKELPNQSQKEKISEKSGKTLTTSKKKPDPIKEPLPQDLPPEDDQDL